MYISFRQKTAGKAEAKKVTGLNFEEIKSKLISEGIEPTSEEIKFRLLDENNLVISNRERDQILNLNLSENVRKRVNEFEAALIIIGAVLSEVNANNAVEIFNWYLETKELQPGSLKINQSDIFSASSIKESFNKIYAEASKEKMASDEAASATIDDDYLSNKVVYDLEEGWRVVYVPAAGEMESFPGLAGTSYDRILEGNKNGLCLGSNMRLYQNNREGKIYSVRDSENNPRVTIRINNNALQEAKGKNNNSPDVKAAEKADAWFKTIKNLDYKNSVDYESFPPLNIEDAKVSFSKNKNEAYQIGWAPHWYGKGIDELDWDIESSIRNFDIKIIYAGFGKYPAFFEKIKPVVVYWCNEYINSKDDSTESILFGENGYKPAHEIFKTYKKLPEMQLAVKTLSEMNGAQFLTIGLQNIPEYKKYIYPAASSMSQNGGRLFIKKFGNEEWAKPYLELAAKEMAGSESLWFLRDFRNEEWAKPYIDIAAKLASYEQSGAFLMNFHKEEWAKPYLDSAAASAAEIDGYTLLRFFLKKEWAAPYLGMAIGSAAKNSGGEFLRSFRKRNFAKPYLDVAAKSAIEDDGYRFLVEFISEKWAAPYIDSAAVSAANKLGYYFLSKFVNEAWAKPYIDIAARSMIEDSNFTNSDFEKFRNEDWANTPIESIGGRTWLEYAESKIRKATGCKTFLTKLSKALISLGFDNYGYVVSTLED